MRLLDGISNSMDMSLSQLLGDSEGQGSLVCYNPCDRKKLRLSNYPPAPSSAFLSLTERVIDWMNGPNSSLSSLDPHLCHRLTMGALYFSTPWTDPGFSHMTCFSHQYV